MKWAGTIRRGRLENIGLKLQIEIHFQSTSATLEGTLLIDPKDRIISILVQFEFFCPVFKKKISRDKYFISAW